MIKKQTLFQYLYNYISQMILLLAPLIVIPYVSRVLGPEQIGKYSYTQSIVTVAILFCTLGISLYAQRETAAVAEDKEKRSRLFRELVLLRLFTVFAGIVVYVVMVLSLEEPGYHFLFFIQLLDFVAAMLDITWFYYGMGLYKRLTACNVFIKLCYVVSVLLFVKTEQDLWIYVLCHSVSLVIGNGLLCIGARKDLDRHRMSGINIRQHVLPVLMLFLPQIATQVYTVLDKSMIGWLTNDMSQNGYYEQATKIVHTILMLITSFGVVMLSDNAKNLDKTEETLKQKTAESMEFILFLALPIAFGCIAVADSITGILLGAEFVAAVPLIRVLSINVMLIAVSNVIGVQYLLVLRRQKEYAVSVLCGAVVNVILNLCMIMEWKALGAAWASVIAEVVVMSVQLVFVRRELAIPEDKKKNIIKCLIASIMMLVVVLLLPDVESASAGELIFSVVIGVVCYVMILLCMKERYCRNVVLLIKNFLRKGRKNDSGKEA